ncbi:hypothetical protein [Nocardia sp. NPDC004123]
MKRLSERRRLTAAEFETCAGEFERSGRSRAAATPHRTGRGVVALPRRGRGEYAPEQLAGFLPKDMPVHTRPHTETVALQAHTRGLTGDCRPPFASSGDRRHLLTDHTWPWILTGRVTNSDGMAGSGVLVGARLVLTADQLRPSQSIARGSWWMTFSPHFDSGADPNAPFGSSNVSDLAHYNGGRDTEYGAGHDFMLCRLFEPMGHRLGFLGATSFADNWRGLQVWHSIGYPADMGGGTRPAVWINQSVEHDHEDDDDWYIEAGASLDDGDASEIFFSWFDDGDVRLCGVVSGAESVDGDLDHALASGDDMVSLINWGRATWPE